MGKRIVFTGGSGKAGRHVVPHLLSHGYEVLNVDLRPLEHPGVHTLIADVTDGGQVSNALTSHLNMAEFLARHCPGVPIRRPLDEFEAPISKRKIREVLGFREQHDWRKYVNPEEPG